MASDETTKKPAFSKENILLKQKQAREDYEKKIAEMRHVFESVAATPEGEKLFRYLFLICGGDIESLRRNKEGIICVNETMVALGTKVVWETLRFNLKSETLKKVERHNWEG